MHFFFIVRSYIRASGPILVIFLQQNQSRIENLKPFESFDGNNIMFFLFRIP